MPDVAEIEAEKLRIYESEALRSDINDGEADVLLKWGEQQVVKLSQTAADAFEEKCRFLRQLIKHINRFVGQREFNNEEEQTGYMDKVVMWLAKADFPVYTSQELMAVLPPAANDTMGTLNAILDKLTPSGGDSAAVPPAPDGGLPVDASAQSIETESLPVETLSQPVEEPESAPVENETPPPALNNIAGAFGAFKSILNSINTLSGETKSAPIENGQVEDSPLPSEMPSWQTRFASKTDNVSINETETDSAESDHAIDSDHSPE